MKSRMMKLAFASALLLTTCVAPVMAAAPGDGGGGPGSDVAVKLDGGGGPGSDIRAAVNVILTFLAL